MHVGYARVSTLDQSLEAQLEALKNAGCEKVFYGKQSGKSEENIKKLHDLIDFVREGDIVLITKFDRLGRSLGQVIDTVDRIHKKGATVKTLDGQIDTSNNSPMGKAMMQLMGMFAELEHSIIVDRLQTGRYRTGRLGGRKRKLSPEQELEVAEKLAAGQSVYSIAKEYKVSRMTIMRVRDRVV
ncbi:recombinase family protein [Photobacterium sp. OFAV2-7]|uniref:recombinase family protein n=1 Tax=Photobacterium sp. OFAV2-7 TaxID=2917748 RepID=UPI001EF5B49F|nr:recombinase family protein [Photobacterium sp. OFAV2-7]MCG7584922.1 recombinase family protein [Photobacterium sp. OFAV2-7]